MCFARVSDQAGRSDIWRGDGGEGFGVGLEGGGWRVEGRGWRVEGGGWRVEGGGFQTWRARDVAAAQMIEGRCKRNEYSTRDSSRM